MDSVCRKYARIDFGKFAAVVSYVVANDNTNLVEVGKCNFKVVRQALGGCAHSVFVHAVAAGTHDATQSAGSEFEVAIE